MLVVPPIIENLINSMLDSKNSIHIRNNYYDTLTSIDQVVKDALLKFQKEKNSKR